MTEGTTTYPARHMDGEGLPPLPQPPAGVSRLDDIKTVEASIRYWVTIRDRAVSQKNPSLARTADALAESYEWILLRLDEKDPGGRDGPPSNGSAR